MSASTLEQVRELSTMWLSLDDTVTAKTKAGSPVVSFAEVPLLMTGDGAVMNTGDLQCGPTAQNSYCGCPTTICGTVQPCVGTRRSCGC